jgi:peptidoglycan/xylan/chitin deacetylase (PgdA/CDA1 family)
MDDGWRGVYTVGLPVIKELDIPITVYVTTYYIENPMPVFTVTASYLFWRCTSPRVVLPRRLGTFDLPAGAEKAEELTQQFGAVLPPTERLEFLKELASALQVSFDEIETQQLFRVMDGTELRALADAGIDIQLHSHHHQWPREARRRRCSSLATRRHLFSGARERVAWNGPSCSSARTCRGHYAGG